MTLVSVLMPMRNGGPFVRAAMESLLAQRDVDLEVVVIDDGSTDQSPAQVRALGDRRVRVLPGPCQGISAAFNAALDAARGELVARCDADDLYPADRLAEQVRWLDGHHEFAAICGRFSTMSHDGRPVVDFDCGGAIGEEITQELLAGTVRTHVCTFTIRTAVLRQMGGCRPYFVTGEDIDLQLRLAEAGRVWFEPRPCYRYRLHEGSITHTQTNARQEFFEATARQFAAQRRSGQPDDLERGCPPPVPANEAGQVVQPGAEIQGLLISRAWEEHRAGHKLRALWTGLRACSSSPAKLAAWKSLAALAWKRSAARPSPETPPGGGS